MPFLICIAGDAMMKPHVSSLHNTVKCAFKGMNTSDEPCSASCQGSQTAKLHTCALYSPIHLLFCSLAHSPACITRLLTCMHDPTRLRLAGKCYDRHGEGARTWEKAFGRVARPEAKPWNWGGPKGLPPTMASRKRSLKEPSPVPARLSWLALRPR